MKHYGKDDPYKGPEKNFQVATARILALAKNYSLHGMLAYHIPNEGKRATWGNDNIKKQGADSGVFDWCIIDLSKPWKVAYIELKNKTGKVSDAQLDFGLRAEAAGCFAAIVWSMDGFLQVLGELGIYYGVKPGREN